MHEEISSISNASEIDLFDFSTFWFHFLLKKFQNSLQMISYTSLKTNERFVCDIIFEAFKIHAFENTFEESLNH